MAAHARVRIGRRFQRAVRIDFDLTDPQAIEGFICPPSSAEAVLTMSRHVSETGQGAFTWTGPYGTGKSSLAVALAALLNGNKSQQVRAGDLFGRRVRDQIWRSLPPQSKGWRILPVLGRRDRAARVIGEALESFRFVQRNKRREWTDEKVIAALSDAAAWHPRSHGGLIIIIDEMGKFLEAAAQEGWDIYIFQQLAEIASRSKGRLLIVGILHQAFEEYAHRLSRDMRDEWAKIQGRFVDLVITTTGEEQIELLSRAIESDHKPSKPSALAQSIATVVRHNRISASQNLPLMLERCWPLHPVVACLLGPISRRRFGQNQRSIFAFLNSAEPHGFQDFLRSAAPSLYEPLQLWDYLRANLEPSILASPDGHRWALAVEAIERCEAMSGNALHIRLLKTIALVDLFKERSGLVATIDLLCACLSDQAEKVISSALDELLKWSFLIFRKFVDAYSIYAGSDFDIEHAVETALVDVKEVNLSKLRSLANLQPVLAKKHYHETGALRWFDVSITSIDALIRDDIKEPDDGTIGQFLLAIPTGGETEAGTQEICRQATRADRRFDVVIGLSQRSWAIVDLARELIAVEKVSEREELAGDAIARREVLARFADLQSQLEAELRRAFESAVWYRKRHRPQRLTQPELNGLASELADNQFASSPRLHNELLNRVSPSSNAVAAQNALLKRMVSNEGEARLGIDGFPAEGGLFVSLLERTELYVHTPQGWAFQPPELGAGDTHHLGQLWSATEQYLKENAGRVVPIAELYEQWRRPPFGVKDGLMSVLVVAFILSRRDTIAFYRQGIFQARVRDLDVEYLAKDASDIQLRWMDLSAVSRQMLSGMAEVVRTMDHQNVLSHLEPIDVARGLVSVFEQLPPWTKRTMRLSANAVRIRTLFKQANDPNKFLFDDIPNSFNEGTIDPQKLVVTVREGLEELSRAYPEMLNRLCNMMLAELQVPNTSPQALAELRSRADNVKELAGDFRLEAFVNRIALFEAANADFEGIASLAADKPLRDWVDADVDRAMFELASMAQKFNRCEAFARVKGRQDKRHSMAVVVGIGGRPTPVLEEFEIADTDRHAVDGLISSVEGAVRAADPRQRHIILAALAELSARYMQQGGVVAAMSVKKNRTRAVRS